MIINPVNQPTSLSLTVLFLDFQNRFWQNYSAAPVWYNRLASTIPVGTNQVLFPWIGMLDKYRKWDGPRIVHQPAPQTYLVQIQPFELTESIDLFRLNDDLNGVYYPTVQFMGIQAAKWPDYQIRDLLQGVGAWSSTNSLAQTGPDGVNFWGTNHPIDFYDASKGTYITDFTGGGQTINSILTGGSLAPNAFATLWQEFASRKSESGEALGVVPDLMMVPAQLNITAMTLLQANMYAPSVLGNLGAGNFPTPGAPAGPNAPMVGAMQNMLKGWVDLLMTPDLFANPNVWYLFCTTKPLKPIIWCLNSAPNFVYRIRPDDPVVFDTHTVNYGSWARGAPAWSLPWLSARSGP